MTRGRSQLLAAGAWGVVALDVFGVALVALGVLPDPQTGASGSFWIFVFLTLTYGAVGARIVTRDRRNRVGWVLWVQPTLLAVSGAGVSYAKVSLDQFAGRLPATTLLAWAGGWGLVMFVVLTALVIPLLFPTGRLPSRRWRPVAALVTTSIVLTMAGIWFLDAPLLPGLANPLGIPGTDEALALANQLGGVGIVLSIPLVIASVVMRFRRGTAVEREQVKWFALGVFVPALLLASALIAQQVELLWVAAVASLGLIPVTIGIAILRYRLVRDRPAREPHDRVGHRHGRARGRLRGTRGDAPDAARPGDAGEHARGGGLHPHRVCPVPAAAAARPAGGGPSVRPRPLRRPAHRRRVRRTPALRGGSRHDPEHARDDGRRGRAARELERLAHEGVVMTSRVAGVRAPGRTRGTTIVWSVIAVLLVFSGVALVIPATSKMPTLVFLVFTAMSASMGIVGALIVTRQPRNAVGWILWVAAVATFVSDIASMYANFAVTPDGAALPGATLVAWLAPIGFFPSFIAILIFVPLLFPDGRYLSRRWRWVGAFGVAVVGLILAGILFTPGPLAEYPTIVNPVGLAPIEAVRPLLDAAGTWGFVIAAPLAIASAFVRYRRGSRVERTQLR